MSYRRRYSPNFNSTTSSSLIKGPSSIYTTTSSVLGGGSYLRDSVSSLRTGSSLSPRRYPRTSLSTSAGLSTTTTSSSSRLGSSTFTSTLPYQTRSRSARITSSSFLNNDSDTFRLNTTRRSKRCSRSHFDPGNVWDLPNGQFSPSKAYFELWLGWDQ